jgi:hypothetical protein
MAIPENGLVNKQKMSAIPKIIAEYISRLRSHETLHTIAAHARSALG